MRLDIVVDDVQTLTYTCKKFDGYDVFLWVQEQLGENDWEKYQVKDSGQILETVFNPKSFDDEVQWIH